MQKYVRSLFPVMLLVLAAGCGSVGIGSGTSVSLDQEWQLGDQIAAQVAQQVQFNNDPAANAYVRAMGEQLHRQTSLANRPFTFHIVNDPSVNAFAIPGGHIYIHSGLIAQADRANMLAGVMAHEMSHVIARHAIKQMEQQQAIGAIGSILLGQNPNAIAQIAAQIAAGGAMARFSREDEQEADDVGLDLMTRAGYNPKGMVDMFNRLLSLEQSRPSAVERFFLGHPLTADRIKDISNRIAKMGNPGGIVDDPQYQSVRARVGG